MDGILVINKPINKTSRDVVNHLNFVFHTKKIGHTGTLDPLATGVLVVVIGNYTKLVNTLTCLDKEYIAEIKLGVKTDTGDITGNILEEDYNYNIETDDILSVFNSFPKTYSQTVPKYSAVKINGKKLYEYARENIDINLPTRLVNIYSLELLEFNNGIIKFKTKVSKGTYIRSLIEDICIRLNAIGTMNSLIRTKQGIFSIENAINLEDVTENTTLLDAKEVLKIKNLLISKDEKKLVINGNKLSKNIENGYYDIYFKSQRLALYKFEGNEGRKIMFY